MGMGNEWVSGWVDIASVFVGWFVTRAVEVISRILKDILHLVQSTIWKTAFLYTFTAVRIKSLPILKQPYFARLLLNDANPP